MEAALAAARLVITPKQAIGMGKTIATRTTSGVTTSSVVTTTIATLIRSGLGGGSIGQTTARHGEGVIVVDAGIRARKMIDGGTRGTTMNGSMVTVAKEGVIGKTGHGAIGRAEEVHGLKLHRPAPTSVVDKHVQLVIRPRYVGEEGVLVPAEADRVGLIEEVRVADGASHGAAVIAAVSAAVAAVAEVVAAVIAPAAHGGVQGEAIGGAGTEFLGLCNTRTLKMVTQTKSLQSCHLQIYLH